MWRVWYKVMPPSYKFIDPFNYTFTSSINCHKPELFSKFYAIPNLIPGAPTTLGSRFPRQIRRYSGVKLIATQSKQESDLGWPRCVCVCELWLWTQTLWPEMFFVWPVSISLILHWLRPSTEVHMDKRFLDKFCCSEDLSVVWNMRTSYVRPEEGKRSEVTIIFFRGFPTVPTHGKGFAGPKNRPGPKFVNCLHYRIVDVSTVKAGPWSWCGLIRNSPMVFFRKFQRYF